MAGPFPGMDPYIEASGEWEDFHDSLIAACRQALGRALPPAYAPRIGREAHWYLEILRVPERRLVTVIEVLSPTNKAGAERDKYLVKRQRWLRGGVHLVEVDLLLGGRRMPVDGDLPPGDYFATVARVQDAPNAEVYAWSIRQSLPVIPVPLQIADGEVPLDLATLVGSVHEVGRYADNLRYDRPLALPLAPEDRAWAESLTAAARRP